MNIAVTGHRGLPQATDELIDTAIRRRLAEHPDDELVGLSCIADGADSIFAQAVLDRADQLLAVWDGQPARGYGGTADIVRAAKERGVPITVVWPQGAQRD